MAYNFTLTKKVGKWEVKIDPIQAYGCFEHDAYGEGGGLWFDAGELSDYDGVFALPRAVGEAIEACGYKVSDDCY